MHAHPLFADKRGSRVPLARLSRRLFSWSNLKPRLICRVTATRTQNDMTAPAQVVGRARSKTTAPPSSPSLSSPTPSTEKPKKDANPRQPQNPQNANVKLKVVVRGLPPNLPESIFKESTKEWINETSVDWYYYVSGKLYERY
jgi:hypothetical protein